MNQLRKWGSKVSLSLIDQILYSGANFVLSILLGRWFPPEQYGAYTIAFSVFLFGSGLYSAIMLEPMRVIGPGRYSGNLKSYFASVIKINYWYSLLPPIITGGVTIVLLAYHSVVAPPFITLTVSFSVILLFWLFRQACYTAFRPDLAARGSLIYAVVLLTLLFLLKRIGFLTVNWAFPLTAIAGLIAFQIYRKPLGLTRVRPLDKEQIILDHVIHGEHVHYGIWILFASLAYSIATLLYPSLIGGFIGLEQAGAYRAMQNLVSPLQQMLAALTFLILPIVSRQVTEQGKEHSRQASRKLGYIYLAVSVVYMALLLVFGRWIIRVLYAQETYLQYYWLLFYIGIATMLFSLSQTLAIHLRAIENTRSIFWSKLFPAVFILLIGIYLTWRMGLTGVVISMIASSLLELAVLLFFVSKVSKPVVEGSL